jgi:hypothetical protein
MCKKTAHGRPTRVSKRSLRVRISFTDSYLALIVDAALGVVRMIKLFGWERKMGEQIAERRDDELGAILKRKILELVWHNIK